MKDANDDVQFFEEEENSDISDEESDNEDEEEGDGTSVVSAAAAATAGEEAELVSELEAKCNVTKGGAAAKTEDANEKNEGSDDEEEDSDEEEGSDKEGEDSDEEEEVKISVCQQRRKNRCGKHYTKAKKDDRRRRLKKGEAALQTKSRRVLRSDISGSLNSGF